jgi:hypothetical protein
MSLAAHHLDQKQARTASVPSPVVLIKQALRMLLVLAAFAAPVVAVVAVKFAIWMPSYIH